LSDIASEPSDFFPLSVNYQERFSAAGRTTYVPYLFAYFNCFPILVFLINATLLETHFDVPPIFWKT